MKKLITVLVVMVVLMAGELVVSAEQSESACGMKLYASINQVSEPNKLYVYGSVTVYTYDSEVFLSEVIPQGINPTILLLHLTVIEKSGPMKGTDHDFVYSKNVGDAYPYVQVEAASVNRGNCVVDVETHDR